MAGVSPGKGGMSVEGIPVYNTVAAAVETAQANCGLIFVPPPAAADAIVEAVDGGIKLLSRSGTLTYEAGHQLTQFGIGQSSAVGIGGDPIHGLSHRDVMAMYEADEETEAILMIGEIGGTSEEEAAEFVASHVTKPVFAYIAGFTAPPGRRMGHAGAIVSGGKGTAESKIRSLQKANIQTIENAAYIGSTIKEALKW